MSSGDLIGTSKPPTVLGEGGTHIWVYWRSKEALLEDICFSETIFVIHHQFTKTVNSSIFLQAINNTV